MAKKKTSEPKPEKKPHAKFLKAIDALAKSYATNEGIVDEPFRDAIVRVNESLPKSDMGIVGMQLHIATWAFLVEWERWANRMDLDPNATLEDQPGDGFWSTLAKLADKYGDYGKPPKSSRAPETVDYLVKTVSNQGQIAAMLGLFTEDGRPDLARLQQEIEKPGSVINDDFLHPDDAKRDTNLELEHIKYVALLMAMDKETVSTDRCPETPEELYRTKVDLDQAIKMLKAKPHELTAEQVTAKYAEFKEAGIPQKGVETTDRHGQPFSEYVPTQTPAAFVPPQIPEEETTVETSNDSVYAQSSDDALRELCEVAEIPSKGKYRSEMIAALEEADKTQAGV